MRTRACGAPTRSFSCCCCFYLPLAFWIDAAWIDDWLFIAVALYMPWYVYRAMRRVYGQGRFVTFVKYCVLSLAYLACVALMLGITTMYTILTL